MRAKEFISESWGIEYYPNPVPMGEYKGPDEDKFLPPGNYKDVSILYDDVDQLLDMGVKPYITNINPEVLLATQPFISNSTGDGALYDELQAYPLVYHKDSKYYILDGHHRSAAAFQANRPITVYLYSEEMLNQGNDRNDDLVENFNDGKKPGRKGLAKRVGVNCKQSVSKLRSIAKNSSGEKQRMAHWCANMKAGRKK